MLKQPMSRADLKSKIKDLKPHSQERAKWLGVLQAMTNIELGAAKPVYRVPAVSRRHINGL